MMSNSYIAVNHSH